MCGRCGLRGGFGVVELDGVEKGLGRTYFRGAVRECDVMGVDERVNGECDTEDVKEECCRVLWAQH